MVRDKHKKQVKKRSEKSKELKRQKIRLKRLNMTEAEKDLVRAKDRERKRKFKALKLQEVVETDCGSDHDSNFQCARLSDRKFVEQKLKKHSDDLINYKVNTSKGLFGKILYDLKWYSCEECKTKSLGFKKKCFCNLMKNLPSSLLKSISEFVPIELSRLSIVEGLLIARVHPVVQIYRLKGGQIGYSGHVVNFFQDVKSFAKKLPHSLPDLKGVVSVCSKSDSFHKDFRIRKQFVIDALIWLKENNKYYKDVVTDVTNLDSLPDDGFYENFVVEGTICEQDSDDESSDEEDSDVISSSAVPKVNVISTEEKLRHNLKWPELGTNPVNELHTKGYIVQAFPVLFPNGNGDLLEVQSKHLSARVYFQYLMEYKDGRFARHSIFPYFALNSILRWECLTKGTVYMRKHKDLSKMNVELLKELMLAGNVVCKDLMVYSSNIRSSREYWLARSSELQAMVTTLGLPTIFFTLSAADCHWPRLTDVLLEHECLSNVSEKERHKVMLNNPKVCCDYFFEKVEVFLNNIVVPHFKVKDFWYRFEWQHRGSPHVHGVLWFLDALNVNELEVNFNEAKPKIIEYFDQFVCCENPSLNFEDVGAHPSRIRVDDVASSERDFAVHPSSIRIENVSDSEKDLIALLNTFQRHTTCSKKTCLTFNKKKKSYACRYHFPKKLREFSDIVVNERNFYEFEGKRNDPLLNKCNLFIAETWRGNSDFTAIASKGGFSFYIAKYASKPEVQSKKILEIFTSMLDVCSTKSTSIKSAVQKTFMNCIVQRDYSCQEVHHILSGKKLFSSSRSFVKLNLKNSEWVYHRQLTDSGSFDDTCNEVFKRYLCRPDCLKNVNLYSFAQKFNIYTYNPKERYSIVQVYPRVLSLEGDHVNVARHLVLLFKPWHSIDDISRSDEEWVDLQQKENLVPEMLPYYNSIPVCDAESESEEEDVTVHDKSYDDWMYIVNTQAEQLPEECELGKRSIDTMYDWKSNFCGVDDFEFLNNFVETNKKNYSFEKVGLTDGFVLNQDQEELMSVLEQQLNVCLRNEDFDQVPQMVICQGNAGCGKSTLIKAMCDRVISVLGPDKVLLVAPTGVSALNVGGQTIHSAFRVQFGRSGDMTDLKGDSLHKFQEQLSSNAILIIDEYSMVGCKMLNFINRRCMQLKSNSKPWGGCAVYLFGDVKQLPPVGDTFLFKRDIPLSNATARAGSLLLKSVDFVKFLTVPQRQCDPVFLQFLENVGHGRTNVLDKDYISDRFEVNVDENELKRFESAVHLFSTRNAVHDYNEKKLSSLHVPVLIIPSENNSKIAAACTEDIACNLMQKLYLSVGCRVMLRSNLWLSAGLVNGACGTVIDILFKCENDESVFPTFILVKFDNYKGPTLSNGTVPIKRVVRSWNVKDHNCSRIQFPLMLCYSMTFHKVQSLTLSLVVLHLTEKERSAGLFYVALSRVKNKNDLLISGSPDNSPLFNMNMNLYEERNLAISWLMSKQIHS